MDFMFIMNLNLLSLQSLAVVMVLLEVLTTSVCGHPSKRYRRAKIKEKSHKKHYQPLKDMCVGGKWFRLGSFRFWQRESCADRRDGGEEPSSETEELHPDDFPSAEGGPEKNGSYVPTYGYEPYWADGDWVFDKQPSDNEEENYAGIKMCGVKCSRMYTEYGKVCARNKNFRYETFDNYCAMKSNDCNGVLRWMVLYRGNCIERDIETYWRWQRPRMRMLMSKYFSKYENTTREYVGYAGDGKPGLWS